MKGQERLCFWNFKKAADEYEFEQRIPFVLQKFEILVNTAEKIFESVVQEKSAKECPTKPPPNKSPQFQHKSVSKDVGSQVWTFSKLFQSTSEKFWFKTVDQKPTDITSLLSYAVCPHSESEFCQIATSHFHLLIVSSNEICSTKQNKSFAVPCLFTTFKHLFSKFFKTGNKWRCIYKVKISRWLQWQNRRKNCTSNGSRASSNFFLNYSNDVDNDKNDGNKNYRNRT